MNNIKSLKKQIKKLKEAKREIERPFYLSCAAEYGKINNISIKATAKDQLKSLQNDTEEFEKWSKYIISNEELREAVEKNESLYAVIDTKDIIIFTDEANIND